MRGEDRTSGALFSSVNAEACIPAKHPLRAMRRLINAALDNLDASFSVLYEKIGWPSIAPVALPEVKRLMSAEHFSVDGTLLKAWASMKSFRPKDGSGAPPPPGRNADVDFRKTKRTKRSNETDASTTDPEARLFRKGDGQESKLAYLGHALMENRNGLVAAAEATLATGTGEREAATQLSERLPEGATLGADKNYDAEAFVEGLKAKKIEPHIAVNATVSKLGKVRKTAVPAKYPPHGAIKPQKINA